MIFSMSLMYSFIENNFKHYFHHYSSSGGNFKKINACAITISTDYTLLDCESLIHVNLISLLFVNVIHVRHQPFPLNGVKKYWTGCCMVCSKIHCLYYWNIFVFCAGKHPCQDCVQVPWVSLWPAQQTWSRCTCRWKAEGGWRENHLGIIRPVYSYDLGLLGYFVRQHFQHMKKIKTEKILDVLCSLVVVFSILEYVHA